MKHLLVDGNNVLVRAVKAAEGSRLTLATSDGIPTAALLIFINTLSRHVREESPDRMVVAWDGGRSTYRSDLYPAYKANRAERTPEEDEHRPFGLAKEFLSLAGIHHIERAGWEADDLIAAHWSKTAPDDRVVILSSDKDLLQLVDANTQQVRVSSAPPTHRWDVARVQEQMGCHPRFLAQLMALTGDVGDNVPGVRGVGPKKGVRFLEAAGWDAVEAVRHLGPEAVALADLSRSLVDLRLPYESLGLRVGPAPVFAPTNPTNVLYGPLLAFLDRYQMASLRTRLVEGSLWSERVDTSGDAHSLLSGF
jgi:5'-3' exonuclease